MTEIVTTVTQHGQVTLPAEVREALGVKPHDKVVFTIENGLVRWGSAIHTLEDAYGSVTPQRQPEDFKARSRAVREEHVANSVPLVARR